MSQDFDYGIIGSGPAGYTAALNAAQKGKKVVLFEKDCVGGVCLNRGCIPTKALLHSAELFETVGVVNFRRGLGTEFFPQVDEFLP